MAQFMAGFIVVLIIVALNYFTWIRPLVQKKQGEKYVETVDRNKESWISVFCIMPNNLISKLSSVFRKLLSCRAIPASSIPSSVFSAVKALEDIYTGKVNRIDVTDETIINEMDKEIDWFNKVIDAMLTASPTVINNAASKGLDFGILTNNAADASLYAAMDAHEKKKNLTSTYVDIQNALQREMSNLKSKFRRISDSVVNSYGNEESNNNITVSKNNINSEDIIHVNDKSEFDEKVKEYFVNMSSSKKTLHKTHGCRYGEYAKDFMTFDSIESVEEYEKEYSCSFKRCGNCFK